MLGRPPRHHNIEGTFIVQDIEVGKQECLCLHSQRHYRYIHFQFYSSRMSADNEKAKATHKDTTGEAKVAELAPGTGRKLSESSFCCSAVCYDVPIGC